MESCARRLCRLCRFVSFRIRLCTPCVISSLRETASRSFISGLFSDCKSLGVWTMYALSRVFYLYNSHPLREHDPHFIL